MKGCMLLLALFATCVLAWTKEDYEIFDLVGAVEAAEGKGTTFYSWLELGPSASTAEISKAYRRKSVQLHPDKNAGDQGHERFARLGVVAAILRNGESRRRYDFFYRNGVPKWRGTGYYYARFRPGIGSVLAFLAILTSALQYLVLKINYIRDLARIETITKDAKLAAWGQKLIPGEGQKKVKVNLGGGPRIDGDGNPVPGKLIDMVVDGDDVFILEHTGELVKLDVSSATKPSIMNTWILRMFQGLLFRAGVTGVSGGDAQESDSDETRTVEMEAHTVTTRERRATTKAGGMRRKGIRNRNR